MIIIQPTCKQCEFELHISLLWVSGLRDICSSKMVVLISLPLLASQYFIVLWHNIFTLNENGEPKCWDCWRLVVILLTDVSLLSSRCSELLIKTQICSQSLQDNNQNSAGNVLPLGQGIKHNSLLALKSVTHTVCIYNMGKTSKFPLCILNLFCCLPLRPYTILSPQVYTWRCIVNWICSWCRQIAWQITGEIIGYPWLFKPILASLCENNFYIHTSFTHDLVVFFFFSSFQTIT